MEDLNITIIQSNLHWANPEANLAMFEEKIWQIDEPTDLIVLPEMFNTGFSMDAQALAEPMNLTTFKWLKQMAEQKKAVVTGSFMVKEGNHFYNRLLWFEPDGSYDFYDKRHLFMVHENEVFSAGNKKIIKDIKGWKICPLICYDLRFPVWSRNQHLAYDVLIYVANWSLARIDAWDILLQARAIENLCYTVGVNRVGKDDANLSYTGHSAIYNYKGTALVHIKNEEAIVTQTLSKTALIGFRDKFPAHLDADDFSIGS